MQINQLQNLSNNLRSLKSRADKFDADLSKLSVVVKNDIVKKDVYNGQIENMEDRIPDITNLSSSTTLNAKAKKIKNQIPSITNLVITTPLNPKINELKNKILNINNLAITTALENKQDNNKKFSFKIAQTNLESKIDVAKKIK